MTGKPGGALPRRDGPPLPVDNVGTLPWGCPEVFSLSSFARLWCSVMGVSPGFLTTRCKATPPSIPPPLANVTRGDMADTGTPPVTLVEGDLDDSGSLVTLEGFGRDWCVFGVVWLNSVAVADGEAVRGSVV